MSLLLKFMLRIYRTLLATNFRRIYLVSNLAIDPGVRIYPFEQVTIGSNTMIGRDVIISTNLSGKSRVVIGYNVMIAHRTLIKRGIMNIYEGMFL